MDETIREVTPGKTRIGWIGTGVMGAPMCGHLMDAGFSVTVFNRSPRKTESLAARGALVADSPAAVAAASDVIFSIVGFPEDVRSVILGADGVVDGASAGAIVVDMTTSRPALAQEIDAVCRSRGLFAVDAPVSGGDVGARNGTLSIMIGGDQHVVDSLLPCWQAMGSTIVRQGNAGAGQHTKMVNQTLIAGGMVSVCEAMLYAFKAGLDPLTVLQSVGSGAAGSWSLNNLAPRIIDNNFDPGFYVAHFIKDMGIALEEAARMNLSLPGLALARQLYESVRARGDERLGTQALQKTLASMSGIDWEQRSA